jgi:hypothetical protein
MFPLFSLVILTYIKHCDILHWLANIMVYGIPRTGSLQIHKLPFSNISCKSTNYILSISSCALVPLRNHLTFSKVMTDELWYLHLPLVHVDWVRLCTWTVTNNMPFVQSCRWYMRMESHGVMIWRVKYGRSQRKNCPSPTVHYKSYMDWPRCKPGPPWWQDSN